MITATDICDLLLEHHSDVTISDSQGSIALHAAALYGHADICRLLLANGRNENEIEPKSKNTALHWAAG